MAGHSDTSGVLMLHVQGERCVLCELSVGVKSLCSAPHAFSLLTGGWVCLWKVEEGGRREGRLIIQGIHPRGREGGRSGCPRLLGSEKPKGLKRKGGLWVEGKNGKYWKKVMSVRLPV